MVKMANHVANLLFISLQPRRCKKRVYNLTYLAIVLNTHAKNPERFFDARRGLGAMCLPLPLPFAWPLAGFTEPLELATPMVVTTG
jgi:hypothetical protein